MDIHVQRLGTINILFGALSFVISLGMFLIYGGPVGMYHSTEDNILGILTAGSAVFHLVIAVPCIVGGYYVRYLAEWSRGLLIVTSALNILNVPLGSIVGCYGLWVLLTPETDPLFSNAPSRNLPKRSALHGKSHSKVTPKSVQAPTTIIPSPRS